MYSLIISSDPDQWDITPAEFPVNRYLELTAPAIAATFKLSNPIKDSLPKLPTVFAYEQGVGAVARIGYIRDLTWSASTLRFGFEFDSTAPELDLELFYRASHHLGIGAYEPSRTHWAIKDVDLAAALEVAGLITPQQAAVMALPVWLRPTPVVGTASHKPPAQVIGNRANLSPPVPLGRAADFPSYSPEYIGVAVPPFAALAGGVSQALHPVQAGPAVVTETKPKIFVVHGRNRELEGDVLLYLTRIGIDPIVLHEQANGGRTLLEKFEEEADGVTYAIVLMTPDDVGSLAGGELKPRARQNVVLELGYFIGKLGKKRVCVLRLGETEDPSDFSGVAYISVGSNDWKRELLRELDRAGIPFDHRRASLV
jgi:hypothetical protein